MTKLRGKHKLMIECYFKNNEQANEYEEQLKRYKPRTHHIVEEICHEEFLAK